MHVYGENKLKRLNDAQRSIPLKSRILPWPYSLGANNIDDFAHAKMNKHFHSSNSIHVNI